ncbi:MAG: rhomboid family intramembrane serine protease, partial [Bdellovibrionaceae bacterium]|nr:rhomboid family intramembrane serine protease [Pseudobdellovibrionaceae bacterium]
LRDRGFLDAAKDFVFSGDQVAISRWKEELITYERRMSQLAVSDFGLRSNRSAPLQWITYQFTHVGVLHLLSNMFFLVVIGASIEAMLGGFSLLLIYLCGGVAGGIFFQFLHPESNLPMVGASAAVSAIMAFYVFYEKRKRVCYLYFVTPLQGQYGHIWLPVWLMVPMFLISDFTSYLTTAHGLQTGVAYSAHIGGIVFGSMLGLTMRFLPQPSRNTA